MRGPDEFYIGYEPTMPDGIWRVVRRAVAALIVSLGAVAAAATFAQHPLPPARFDYGHARMFRGWLMLTPIPSLFVLDGDGVRRYWLVGRGKFGATATLAGHQEGPVGLEGTLIARDGWQMLELVPGSVQRLSETVTAPPVVNGSRRHVRLHGEIVDSKCYLGVMNPGADAAHRDCAVRCLSGGVPPMFAYRGAEGSMHLAWLLGPGMAVPDAALRRLAGTRVDLAGELVTVGDDEVFVVEAP